VEVGRVVREEVEDPLRRRQYRKPPVMEAIARLQWSDLVPWTFTTPGSVFEKLRDLYPEEPRTQGIMQAGLFAPEEGGIGQVGGPGINAGFEVRAGPQRVLYSDQEGTRLLGLSPGDISVHGLRPYEGWESLESRLRVGLERLTSIMDRGSAKVSMVGLRYINRIEIPESALEFEDYLNIDLNYPPGYPTTVTAFLDRVEMQYDGENVGLAFTWASTEAAADSAAFMLDLDLTAQLDRPLSVQESLVVLQDLKMKEGRAFEGVLKDRLREQFGEIH